MWVVITVRAHSSGPEVERGRWPNLGFFLSGWEDILRENACESIGLVTNVWRAEARDLIVRGLRILICAIDAMKEHGTI